MMFIDVPESLARTGFLCPSCDHALEPVRVPLNAEFAVVHCPSCRQQIHVMRSGSYHEEDRQDG